MRKWIKRNIDVLVSGKVTGAIHLVEHADALGGDSFGCERGEDRRLVAVVVEQSILEHEPRIRQRPHDLCPCPQYRLKHFGEAIERAESDIAARTRRQWPRLRQRLGRPVAEK